MRLGEDEEGTQLLEYSMLSFLIAACLVGTLIALGSTVKQLYQEIGSWLFKD